jgi:CrcB protein
MTWLWLALGGGIGTLGRYALAGAVAGRFGSGPLGIFAVNISGAFAIGFFLVVAGERGSISVDVQRFVATGLLGGYTTFSTLSLDTTRLLETGDYLGAAANGLGSLVAGVLAVWLGMTLARAL